MAGGWSARARMSGPLVEFVEGFEAELARLGYAPGSLSHQLRLMGRLDAWLVMEGLTPAGLTAAGVGRFIASQRTRGKDRYSLRALEPLLGYLRRVGAAPAPAAIAPVSELERLLERYRRYLRIERGLAAITARRYVRIAGQFLAGRESAAGLDLDGLGPEDVTAFMVAWARTGRDRYPVTVLRSLLRFLQLEGIVGPGLVAAVPRRASWRLAGLPWALEAGQARQLVDSCDRSTVIGRRDRAILLLLWRLALRRGEVAALALDDIDWRAGELTVANGKRGRRDRLPLPVDVGEAIVVYLRDGRPATAHTRCVFVRVRAPWRGLTAGGVGEVVIAAGVRCGIGEIGAHRLRHTAATELLRAGAPLGEIGQLLRHRLAKTTAIYAKVDDDALRQLARPWPGGAS